MPDAAHSAWRVALRRAAHQLYDVPLIFEDPYAVPLLGAAGTDALRRTPAAAKRVWSRSLRAFVVARQAFAESCLTQAYEEGTRQYCLLGAGLDTFAWRNPWPDLRIWELDLPPVGRWKAELAHAAGLPKSRCERVEGGLDELSLPLPGMDGTRPVFFAMLGVVPFLPPELVTQVLARIRGCAPGSAVVFDYRLPREQLSENERKQFDSLQKRATAKGEPFSEEWTPETLRAVVQGFARVEDVGRAELQARYFAGRGDGLAVLGEGARIVLAAV